MHVIFNKEKTLIVKGVAILTMILHHCIVVPTGYWWLDMFGNAMKICISYFTFLVGFGYAFSKQKTLCAGLQRAFKLLIQFWFLLFTIFLPLYLIYGGGKIDLYHLITEPFGLESQWHWFSWYLYFYIYAMVIMPFASRLIDKYKLKAVVFLVVLSYLLEFSVHCIPNYSNNIFSQAAFDCFLNSPLLFLGYYMSKEDIYGKIYLKKEYTILMLPAFIVVIVCTMCKRAILGFMLDFFYVPVLVFIIVGVFSLYRLNFLKNILLKLGKVSMPMWFLHALFVMPYVTFSGTIFDYWLIKYILVVVLSYILAFLYYKLTTYLFNLSLFFNRK